MWGIECVAGTRLANTFPGTLSEAIINQIESAAVTREVAQTPRHYSFDSPHPQAKPV